MIVNSLERRGLMENLLDDVKEDDELLDPSIERNADAKNLPD
jgi:hypothetical protein